MELNAGTRAFFAGSSKFQLHCDRSGQNPRPKQKPEADCSRFKGSFFIAGPEPRLLEADDRIRALILSISDLLLAASATN